MNNKLKFKIYLIIGGNIMNNHGIEIIDLLKNQGIQIDEKVENTINLIAFEVFEKGKNEGVQEGINIGIKKACKEFEIKIGILRSKAE